MDTASEEAYDDLASLAARVCEAPIGIISLVDEERQWFKSRVGIALEQTSRDVAFCAHAILQSGPLIVKDALEDDRFADNPLVNAEPRIRFYAGFPLVCPEGYVLGTLCAMDQKPRQISAWQQDIMEMLGRQVMALLELRRVAARMAEALQTIRTPHGVLPLCGSCKRVRDVQGWVKVEIYIAQHSDAEVTTGICPECIIREHHGQTGAPPALPPRI